MDRFLDEQENFALSHSSLPSSLNFMQSSNKQLHQHRSSPSTQAITSPLKPLETGEEFSAFPNLTPFCDSGGGGISTATVHSGFLNGLCKSSDSVLSSSGNNISKVCQSFSVTDSSEWLADSVSTLNGPEVNADSAVLRKNRDLLVSSVPENNHTTIGTNTNSSS